MSRYRARELAPEEKEWTRPLWEAVFPEDEARFLDYYFTEVYKTNEVFAVIEDAAQPSGSRSSEENDQPTGTRSPEGAGSAPRALSMAHFNPYTLWVRGSIVPSRFILSVATLPSRRRRGLMAAVLRCGLEKMHLLGVPFVYLLPVDPAIYTPFGFVTMERPDCRALVPAVEELQALLALPAEALRNEASTRQARFEARYEAFPLQDERYLELLLGEYRGDPQVTPPEPLSLHGRMGRVTDPAGFLCLARARSPFTALLAYTDPLLPQAGGLYRWEVFPDRASCRRIAPEGVEISTDSALVAPDSPADISASATPDDPADTTAPYSLGPAELFSLVFAGDEPPLPAQEALYRHFPELIPIRSAYFVEEV